MWCVFITVNGAYCKFVAFADEFDRMLVDHSDNTNQLYAAFPKQANANRFVDLINSATF